MKLSAISLHPAMTLQNMAAWCALHDRVLVITWRVRGGELQPVATATQTGDQRLFHATLHSDPAKEEING